MSPGHISSISCGSLSPSAAAAVLASRAEMPIRIAPVTSFSKRPAAGLVEFVEPARQLLRQLGLAEGAKRGDHLGQGRRRRIVVAVASVKRIVLAVPLTLTLPLKGGGNGTGYLRRSAPSPLVGEGWGGG